MYNRSTSLLVSTIFQVDPFRNFNDHCCAEMYSSYHFFSFITINEFNHLIPTVTKNRELREIRAPSSLEARPADWMNKISTRTVAASLKFVVHSIITVTSHKVKLSP
jgi:hypothetical protein